MLLISNLIKVFEKIKLILNNSSIYKSIKDFCSFYFGGLYDRMASHHVFLMSGGLAFSIFTCIIPFVLVLFSVLGTLLEIPSVEGQIRTFIKNAIPYPETSKLIQDFVFERIHEFKMLKTMAGYLGAIALLIAASGLFSSLRTILNSLYGFVRVKSAVVGKLRDIGMVFFVILFVLLTTILLPILDILDSSIENIPFLTTIQVGVIQSFFLSSLAIFVVFIILSLVYYFVPDSRLEKKVVFLSAFWFSLLWIAANKIFGYYITNFATLKNIYGAYVFLIVGIFWIYYSSAIFIIAAEIGQLFRERRAKISDRTVIAN